MVKKTVLYAWIWQVLNIYIYIYIYIYVYKFPEEKEIEKAIFYKKILDINEQVSHTKIINSSNKAKIRNLGKYTL